MPKHWTQEVTTYFALIREADEKEYPRAESKQWYECLFIWNEKGELVAQVDTSLLASYAIRWGARLCDVVNLSQPCRILWGPPRALKEGKE